MTKPLPVSMHTDHISSLAMLSNNYDFLLRALFTSEENSVTNEAIVIHCPV